MDVPWGKPVFFYDNDALRDRLITSCGAAFYFLVTDWRWPDSCSYDAAVTACLNVSKNEASIDEARSAFVHALYEAELNIYSDEITERYLKSYKNKLN